MSAALRAKSTEELFAEMMAHPRLKSAQAIRERDRDAEALDLFKRAERQAIEEAKRLQRGTYRRLGKLLNERTTVEWLIRDFVEAGVLALFAGPRGSYKSALVNDIAMRIALKGLPVFILSPEGSGLQRRLQGWLDEFAPFEDADALPLYVRDRRLNLSAAEEMQALAAWLDEIEAETGKPVAFIAIDTWSKATSHDENENTATKLLIGEIDKYLRHRGPKPATVAILAHTGHGDQTRARGASALAADTDAEYIIALKGDTVCVTRARFKDSPALPPLYFKPKPRTLSYADGEGVAATSVVLLPADAPGKVHGEMTELQAALLEHACKIIRSETSASATAALILDTAKGRGPDLKRRLDVLVRRGSLMKIGDKYSVPPGIVEGAEGY